MFRSLPIRKIVLYKHGVASFERVGKVKDDTEIELFFRKQEMNNVLKSLTVVDDSGRGVISSITYDNDKPFEKKIEDTVISLNSSEILPHLLNTNKGVEITIKLRNSDEEINGVIVGTSTHHGEKSEGLELCLLIDYSILRSIPLSTISQYQIQNDRLKKDFKNVLNLYKSTKKSDLKKISILTKGEGERDISIAYTNDTPIWKVSYRIVLQSKQNGEQNDDQENENCLIQGWAIIDNTSDETWEGVSLTLVSGQPHSVSVELYSPNFANSPPSIDILPIASPYAHPFMPQQMMQQQQQQQQMPQQMLQPMMNRMQMNVPMNFAPPGGELGSYNAQSDNIKVEELGDLFKYEIEHPVTIYNNTSALVPIINTKCIAPRVILFNSEKHKKHPNSAVLFTNSSNLTLEAGPVVIFDNSTYVGETMLEVIKPKQTKFLEFSTESSVDMWSKTKESFHTYRCAILNGNLVNFQHKTVITEYHIRNRSSKVHTCYIEHRFIKESILVSSDKPTNPNPINFYIFKTKSVPLDTFIFSVSEQSKSRTSYSLKDINSSLISTWLSKQFIDTSSYETLTQYLNISEEIQSAEQRKQVLREQNNRSTANQERLRQLMQSLSNQYEAVCFF